MRNSQRLLAFFLLLQVVHSLASKAGSSLVPLRPDLELSTTSLSSRPIIMNGASSSVQGVNDDELSYQSVPASKCARVSFLGLCPLCGATRDLVQTANYRAVVIAKNADPDTEPLFETHEVNSANDTFRICGSCYSVVSSAIKVLCASSLNTNDVLSSILDSKTARSPAKALLTVLASQGQPLIALFKSIARNQRTVQFLLPSMAAEPATPRENIFAVGDLVELPRRTQPNVNKEGGTAKVLSFECKTMGGKRFVLYSVKVVIGGRVQNDVDQSLLTPSTIVDSSENCQKKRRSINAEAAAEARETDLLKKKIAELEQRNINLEAEAVHTRKKMLDLQAKFKGQQRAASELGRKNDELTVKMEVQFDLMQKSINELLAEATSHAQSEAALASSTEREKRNESMRLQQKKHAQEVKALKGEVREATAARLQLESTVGSMLEGTAKTVAEGYEAEVADLHATIAEHEKEVCCKVTIQRCFQYIDHYFCDISCNKVDSLAGVAQALKAKAPSRLTPKTGTQSSSTAGVGRNERQAILQTLVSCFEKILDVAAVNGDVDGLRKLLHESGKLSAIFGAPLEKEEAEISEIIENIVRVYQLYKRQKKYGLAKALLSLLAPAMTYSKLMSVASTHTPVSVGDLVIVSSSGHTKVAGKVEAVNNAAQTCDIHIHVRSEKSKAKRWITYGQEAKAMAIELEPTLESRFNVPLASVTVLGDVRCTMYEAKAARVHASSNCAGWYSTEQSNFFLRIRKSLAFNEALANHLMDERFFSPDQSSKFYGARRLMIYSMIVSLNEFRKKCIELGIELPRKEDYNKLLKRGGYKKQVPENCVCVYCRTLGNETFDELESTIAKIMLPEEFVKEFVKRSKSLRKYSCATYARELKEQHSDPHLCMKYALTTANNECFKDCCTHFREGESCARPSEPTMDDLANKPVEEGGRGQNATDDCWDSVCSGCDRSGLRSVMCNNCAVVMCMNCVQRTRDDIFTSISGQGAFPVGENSTKCPTGWRCHHCQEEESLCRHRCENGYVAETYNLTAEISNAAEVHGIKVDHLRDFPDLEGADTPNTSKEENALDGLRARLRHIVRNLELLRAHKIRTVKLRTVRKDVLDDLNLETVLEWKDYMGKLDARKSKQGTSENLGRKISLHGSLFIMQNPPQHIRDAHEHIDFSKFPGAEERCLLQVNMYGASDESRQSAFHMGSVMSVQYKALKEAFPWLKCAIPYSDQCGDYRSTASTIFNHEMGRLTGIRVKFALHSEVGEGKGEVDMRFGQNRSRWNAF